MNWSGVPQKVPRPDILHCGSPHRRRILGSLNIGDDELRMIMMMTGGIRVRRQHAFDTLSVGATFLMSTRSYLMLRAISRRSHPRILDSLSTDDGELRMITMTTGGMRVWHLRDFYILTVGDGRFQMSISWKNDEQSRHELSDFICIRIFKEVVELLVRTMSLISQWLTRVICAPSGYTTILWERGF